MTLEQEAQAFEFWARLDYFCLAKVNGKYTDKLTVVAWSAWRARATEKFTLGRRKFSSRIKIARGYVKKKVGSTARVSIQDELTILVLIDHSWPDWCKDRSAGKLEFKLKDFIPKIGNTEDITVVLKQEASYG